MTADDPVVESRAAAYKAAALARATATRCDMPGNAPCARCAGEARHEVDAAWEHVLAAAWPVFRETAAAAVEAVCDEYGAYQNDVDDNVWVPLHAVRYAIHSLPAPTTDRTDGGEGA